MVNIFNETKSLTTVERDKIDSILKLQPGEGHKGDVQRRLLSIQIFLLSIYINEYTQLV